MYMYVHVHVCVLYSSDERSCTNCSCTGMPYQTRGLSCHGGKRITRNGGVVVGGKHSP